MAAMMVERWAGLGSAAATVIFLWSVVQNYVPPTFRLYLTTWAAKVAACFNPYLQITISEYGAQRFQRSDFFLAVEAYLSDACARRARKLKAELGKDSKNLQVTVDDHEEVTDEFSGTTIWWYASKRQSKANVISLYPGADERRFYRVVFHRRHRDLVVDSYGGAAPRHPVVHPEPDPASRHPRGGGWPSTSRCCGGTSTSPPTRTRTQTHRRGGRRWRVPSCGAAPAAASPSAAASTAPSCASSPAQRHCCVASR